MTPVARRQRRPRPGKSPCDGVCQVSALRRETEFLRQPTVTRRHGDQLPLVADEVAAFDRDGWITLPGFLPDTEPRPLEGLDLRIGIRGVGLAAGGALSPSADPHCRRRRGQRAPRGLAVACLTVVERPAAELPPRSRDPFSATRPATERLVPPRPDDPRAAASLASTFCATDHRMIARHPLAIALLCLSTSAPCQAPTRAAADHAFEKRDWARAADAYTAIARPDSDIELCYRLGYCLHAQAKFDEALVWHRRAADQAARNPQLAAKASYNIACAEARTGDKSAAIAALRSAIERGYRNTEFMLRDDDLGSLREEPEFRALLAAVDATRKLVAVVVHENVEMIDFAGPVEVFAAARGPSGESTFRVVLVAPSKQPVHPSRLSATVQPDHDLEDCPQPAVLVVPGGDTDRLLRDPAFMSWLQRTAPKCEVVLSVCTGAFALAQTGLLDGKPATTFHGALDGLQRRAPKVLVQRGVKFVDSGLCVTAAGVSSGIEGALHVVQRLCGAEQAKGVAEYMEYAWPLPAAPGVGSAK